MAPVCSQAKSPAGFPHLIHILAAEQRGAPAHCMRSPAPLSLSGLAAQHIQAGNPAPSKHLGQLEDTLQKLLRLQQQQQKFLLPRNPHFRRHLQGRAGVLLLILSLRCPRALARAAQYLEAHGHRRAPMPTKIYRSQRDLLPRPALVHRAGRSTHHCIHWG